MFIYLAFCRRNVRRIAVVCFTHTDPERGDPQCQEGVGVEMGGVSFVLTDFMNACQLLTLSKFLDEVIGVDLLQFAQKTHSLFILEMCGSAWSNVESQNAIKKYAQK